MLRLRIDDYNADIALGDFNAPPSEPLMQPIRDRLIVTTVALELNNIVTSPRQVSQIDYVFVRGNVFTPVGGGLYPSQYHWVASDHNAFYAGLDFK